MTELDPKGLEAAEKYALSEGWVAPDDDDIAFLVGIIRAYLDAARASTALAELQRMGQECEREPDRLAVVCDAGGRAMGHSFSDGIVPDWRGIEDDADQVLRAIGDVPGPFRRQIVRVHLLRPEPVAEVEGLTSDA